MTYLSGKDTFVYVLHYVREKSIIPLRTRMQSAVNKADMNVNNISYIKEKNQRVEMKSTFLKENNVDILPGKIKRRYLC